MAAIILGGFLLGLAGSLHCVGMCGPIAISMPGFIGKPALLSRALYLTGKALTYTLLGFVFGLVGQRIALAGFQQALSIATGSLLLVWVLFWWLKPALLHSNWLTIKLSKWIAPAMGYFVHKRGAQASLLVGLLNGLLP
ncbi:MAG TPA: sulfite exporter TauE/SafE family protein, partial [Phnomibacter sp.]|nr:sulfite exporter TauE/SafE family protein [Phnomibacter sp.]